MASKCDGCGKNILDLHYMECSKCRGTYDLLCVNMAKDIFNNLTEEKKSQWLCPSCVCLLPRGDNSATPVRHLASGSPTLNNTYTKGSENNVNMLRGSRAKVHNQTLTPVATPPGNFELQISTQLTEIKEYLDLKLNSVKEEILAELAKKVSLMENSVQEIRSQHTILNEKIQKFDDALNFIKLEQEKRDQTINKLSQEIVTLKQKKTDTENENCLLKSKLSEINTIQRNLNELEQRARLNNLEIFGVPEKSNEDLFTVVSKIASSLEITLTRNDLDYVARIPSSTAASSQLPKTIVIKFRAAQLRDTFLSAARKKRGLTSTNLQMSGECRQIFINEHLTSHNKALLKAARQQCKELGFQNIWTRNAKIYIRKHSKSPAIRIINMEQVEQLKHVK